MMQRASNISSSPVDTLTYGVVLMVWLRLLKMTSTWIAMNREIFFCSAGRCTDRMKALAYEGDGFVFVYKRA